MIGFINWDWDGIDGLGWDPWIGIGMEFMGWDWDGIGHSDDPKGHFDNQKGVLMSKPTF